MVEIRAALVEAWFPAPGLGPSLPVTLDPEGSDASDLGRHLHSCAHTGVHMQTRVHAHTRRKIVKINTLKFNKFKNRRIWREFRTIT